MRDTDLLYVPEDPQPRTWSATRPYDHPVGCQCPYPVEAAERDRLAALRGAVPEAGSREGLRAAYQYDNPANEYQRGYNDGVDVGLRAALGDTQEPRPDPLDVERLAAFLRWVDHRGEDCEHGPTCSALAREYAAASPAAPETPRGVKHDPGACPDCHRIVYGAAPETREPNP